ncbi:helix-turn-helix domain-containing protein [Vaginisenegalia massiliensis]|uniref:helix-turn-helix domain-containing protein n=1 Tax=Vaginisenegalia massiliensis TaxID=2058294 RepID=UPI000F51F31D|nr:helix-turn-helix domain-containing protein [Vaginisenegalia massiliensis]
MRELLTKTELRQLRLLEILSSDEQHFVLKKIAKDLKCSTRILLNDFDFLAKELDYINLTKRNAEYSFRFADHISPTTIYQSFIKRSLAFKFLEGLLYYENMSIQDWAQELNVSSSTLYRTLNKVSEYLQNQYRITITTNPIQLMGDERLIRKLYYTYITETYTPMEWPFSTINLDKFYNNCFQLYSLLSPDNEFSNFNFFIKLIAVNYLRIQNQHLVAPQKTNSSFNSLIKKLPDLSTLLINTFDLSKADFYYQLFYPYFDHGFIIDRQLIDESNILAKETHKQCEIITHFLNDLQTDLAFKLDDIDTLTLKLSNLIYWENNNISLNTILSQQEDALVHYFSLRFPIEYNLLKNKLTKLLSELNLDHKPNLLKRFFFTLLLNGHHFYRRLFDLSAPIKVLIFNSESTTTNEWLLNYLKYELTDQLEISLYNLPYFSYDSAKLKEFDIILSHYDIPEINHPNFRCINILPTDPDIEEILTLIYDINRSGHSQLSSRKDDINEKPTQSL